MRHILIPILLSYCMLAVSCSKDDSFENPSTDEDQGIVVPDDETIDTNGSGSLWATDAANDVVDSSDEDYVENSTFSNEITIRYTGTAATATGVPASGVTISINGADVTVTSSIKEVAYVIKGETTNGSLKIYSDKKFKMVLDSAVIKSTAGPAINIQSSKRVFVVLADKKTSKLTDAATYSSTTSGEDSKAAFFSEGQLVFSGTGKLIVSGNYKHAICSDEYIRMRPGTTIFVASAASDGLHANDKIYIGGGLLNVTATGDGIQAEEGGIDILGGEVVVNTADDAIVADYDGTDNTILPYVNVAGGKVTIKTSGEKGSGVKSTGAINISGGELNVVTNGNGAKALSSDKDMLISGGTLLLKTYGSAFYDSDDADISSPSCIKCDGNLSITGGSIDTRSTGSAGKGISVDGNITISGAGLTVVTTGKQYVYGNLDSSPKGIKAEGNLTINGGTISVVASGGEGSEGIESKNVLTINDGTVEVECYDDCINAAKGIIINGGKTYCLSSGNDAIDSNGYLTVTGGVTIASGTSTPEGGFDADQNTFKITGGILIGTGGASSSPTASVCTQRSILYGGTGNSGWYINITGSDNKNILVYKIPKSYNQMTFLFSSPDLNSSVKYTISSGGTISGGTDFHGYFTGATYTGGNSLGSFTPSSMVTTIGNVSSGGGGNPGNPGGNRP